MTPGIIDIPSRYSVPETLARLQSLLKEKGVTVFALTTTAVRPRKPAWKCAPHNCSSLAVPRPERP